MSVDAAETRLMRVIVAPDYDRMSALALEMLRDALCQRPDAVISLTTGHTPAGLYRALRQECQRGSMTLAAARVVSSEEYAGVGIDDPISLLGWLRRDVLVPCGVPLSSALYLSGGAPNLDEECRRFDAHIDQLGGIDLVVQTIGVNGHFGFNEPGTARDAPSRVATLAPSTRQSNAAYWPRHSHMPATGLTMGMGATLRARHVLLLAAGCAKAAALAQAIDGPIDEAAPCSLLRLAPRLTVIADQAAAAYLGSRAPRLQETLATTPGEQRAAEG